MQTNNTEEAEGVMKNNKRYARGAVLGGVLALLSGGAVAATTLAGGSVSYTFDETALGLFGSASISGGSLVFTPSGFVADGTSMAATETINITVTAASGYVLTGFSLNETGGYALPLAGDTAWATGSIKAIDIEGTTGNQLPVSFSGILDGGVWAANAAITLPAAGWGGADGKITSVTLTLSNQLFAMGDASIWKDGVGIGSTVTAVPEAHSYGMFLAGLGLVGYLTRRRGTR